MYKPLWCFVAYMMIYINLNAWGCASDVCVLISAGLMYLYDIYMAGKRMVMMMEPTTKGASPLAL